MEKLKLCKDCEVQVKVHVQHLLGEVISMPLPPHQVVSVDRVKLCFKGHLPNSYIKWLKESKKKYLEELPTTLYNAFVDAFTK